MSRGEVFGIFGASAVAIGMGVIGYRLVFGEREKRAAEAKVASVMTKADPSAEREFGRDEPIGPVESDDELRMRVTPEAVASIALAVADEMMRPNITGEDIQKVVTKIRPRVKRECWQPVLDARRPDDPTQVRISFEVVVDPD